MGIRANLALALAIVASACAARAGEAPAVASAVELTDQGVFARLTFNLSHSVEATARPVVDPGRIVIDLGEVDFEVDPAKGRFQLPRPDAIVKGFRFGAIEPASRASSSTSTAPPASSARKRSGRAGFYARATIAVAEALRRAKNSWRRRRANLKSRSWRRRRARRPAHDRARSRPRRTRRRRERRQRRRGKGHRLRLCPRGEAPARGDAQVQGGADAQRR